MLNLRKMRSNDKLVINLNKDNIKYYLKNTKKIRIYCDRNNLNLDLFYLNKPIENIKLPSNDIKDMITIMKATNIKNKKKRYSYIYDTVCEYLDYRIRSDNYCDFIADVCIRDRLNGSNHKNGCCECLERGKCKYLINSTCTMKTCLACKLFTCHTLTKKGIKQKINDYVLIKYFFTNKQKDILQFSYWTPKEIVIDRLIKNKYIRP